jgi:hypothetical protein
MTRRVLQFLAPIVVAVLAASIVLGCVGTSGSPSSLPLPSPTCGGIKIKIEGALSCERLVEIAIVALRERAPQQLARGISAIDVMLATCPRGEVPPQVECGSEDFAQLVTVSFGAAAPGGPIEPSLTVAIAPVGGRLLGIANPLIR